MAGARPIQALKENSVRSLNAPQETSLLNQVHSNGNTMSDLEGNGRDRLPDRDDNNNGNYDNTGYIVNCIHKNRPFLLNDIARPVFMNNYYAGEHLIPATSKKLICAAARSQLRI